MLKKTIAYVNPFTNVEVSEEHYFHISKADLVEMEMEEHGTRYDNDGQTLTGMQAKLQRIIDAEDGKAIIAELKDIIRRSYGKKEGDRFLKTKETWEDFASSEAFSQLLFDLCTDAGAASDFINGVVPHDLEKIAAEVKDRAEQAQGVSAEDLAEKETVVESSADEISPIILTDNEMREMDRDELQSGLVTGRYKLS